MSIQAIQNSLMEQDPPDPEVSERAHRRRFTVTYKTKILKITDELGRGEIAGFLRQEGLYWTQLQTWRKQREEGTLGVARKRGRKPSQDSASAQLAKLRRENARLMRKLHKAETVIELQKKLSELLGINLPESDVV